MLLTPGQRRYELPAGVDSIHNYYEHLVLEEISETSERAHDDVDYLADIACVALNHLPPRYIRHNVDMTFFMSREEMNEIHSKVVKAVKDAIQYVNSRDPSEVAAPSEATQEASNEASASTDT